MRVTKIDKMVTKINQKLTLVYLQTPEVKVTNLLLFLLPSFLLLSKLTLVYLQTPEVKVINFCYHFVKKYNIFVTFHHFFVTFLKYKYFTILLFTNLLKKGVHKINKNEHILIVKFINTIIIHLLFLIFKDTRKWTERIIIQKSMMVNC